MTTEIGGNEIVITTLPNRGGDFPKSEIKTDIIKSEVSPSSRSVITLVPMKAGMHSCPRCSESFVRESELSRHISERHGIKCPFCESRDIRDLADHLLNSHPERLQDKKPIIPPVFLPRNPVPQSELLLPTLEEANLLLTVGSAPSSRPTSPIRNHRTVPPLPQDSYPVNLSVRRVGNKFHRNSRSAPVSDDDESSADNNNHVFVIDAPPSSNSSSNNNRKRRKQTHVPDQNKDERYWARRLKNNEAAKRSRDMRIKRERVIFEENARLEKLSKELRADLDKMTMDNKELTLKMGLIMEENSRLKTLLSMIQQGSEEVVTSTNGTDVRRSQVS